MAVRLTFNTLLPMLYLYFRSIYLFHVILSSCFSSGSFTGQQRVPPLSHVQGISCAIFSISCMQYPYSCFSSHFCFLDFVVLLFVFMLTLLFMTTVINLSLLIFVYFWVHILLHQPTLQCWWALFLLLFLHIFCQCHLLDVRLRAFSCPLVLLSSSTYPIKEWSRVSKRRTALVFISLM